MDNELTIYLLIRSCRIFSLESTPKWPRRSDAKFTRTRNSKHRIFCSATLFGSCSKVWPTVDSSAGQSAEARPLFTSRIVCSQHDRWRYCQWYEFLRIIFNGIYYISYFCCCKCQVSILGMKTRKLHQPILKRKTDAAWLCGKLCDHQLHLLGQSLSAEMRMSLKTTLFRDLILSGSDTCIGLINSSSIDTWMMRPARMPSVRNWDKCVTLYRNEVTFLNSDEDL